MKQSKTFLSSIAIGIAALIGIGIAIIAGGSDNQHGNKLTMKYLDNTGQIGTKTTEVKLFLENSMSMKGYVERQQNLTLDSMIFEKIVGEYVSKFGRKDYRTTWQCGNKEGKTTSELYQNGISNGSIFSGGGSPLQKYIEDIGLQANDTTISIFISDLVFSMSNSEMQGNAQSIKQNLPKLQTLLKDALLKLEKNNIELLIIQYLSDFNGTYYYNYTNNMRPCSFRGREMKNRPFYVVVFGTEQNLKSLIADDILPKFNRLWVTFDIAEADMKTQDVQTQPDEHWYWYDYDPEGTDSIPFSFWTDTDWEQQCSKVNLKFDKTITTPPYSESIWEATTNSKCVSNINKVSEKEIIVNFIQFDKLNDQEQVNIYFTSNRYDWQQYSISDDILPNNRISELEEKTWEFNKLMETIQEVYPKIQKTDTIGRMTFLIMKE